MTENQNKLQEGEAKSVLLKQSIALSNQSLFLKREAEIKENYNQNLNTESVLPEKIFISDFLPMFLGQIDTTPERLQIWYSIAGSPFNSVVLIDEDNNPVIKVPPVLNRDIVKMKTGESNISSLFSSYTSMLNISPAAAENMMADNLIRNYLDDNNNNLETSNTELIDQWKKLLSHYSGNKEEVIKSSTKVSVVDNDIEY